MKELYHLIKSLSADEKKYFRRYGLKDDTKGVSKTEALFDLLEDLDSYDEEKIGNLLKRRKLDKSAAHTRSYLYETLIDTLLWYYKSDIPGLSYGYMTAKAKLLSDRGLDEDAAKITAKVAVHTNQHGSFAQRWDVLGDTVYTTSNDFLSDRKNDYNHISVALEERSILLSQMQQYHEYESLLIRQMRAMRKTMVARKEDDIQTLTEIFDHPLVQDRASVLSRESAFLYHTLRLHHFYIFNKRDDFFEEAKALVDFVKRDGVDHFPVMRILWAYSQVTQACYFTQRWEELEAYLHELDAIRTQSPTEETAKFSYHAQLYIALLGHKGDIDKLIKTLHETVAKLHTLGHRLRPDIRLALSITCVSAYMEYGLYALAVDLCEDFLTRHDSGVRLDALLMLYVYEYICHLELGNQLYVNNTIQNVYRYFLRYEYNGEFENALLKALKSLSAMDNYRGHMDELEKIKAELTNAGGGSSDSRHVALIPLMVNFIDAKMHQKQIHEWMRRES